MQKYIAENLGKSYYKSKKQILLEERIASLKKLNSINDVKMKKVK